MSRLVRLRRARSADPFYEPPADLDRFAPGEVIRAEPMRAFVSPGVPIRGRAWRMLYRSTSAVGEPTAVSGTLLIPGRGGVTRPLVGYAIGTHGIGDHAAPSRLLRRGLDFEAGLIALTVARGWGVAVTDYQGLGTPGDHTYMVGRALGPNVLDSMRAARRLRPAELPADGPAGIIGYSEGGAAAGWAAELQPTYAPDLPLVGAAVGAAAGDLEAGAGSVDGTFFSFFSAYGAIGYAAAYPELDLDPYLTPAGRRHMPRLRNSSIIQAAIWGPHFARADDLTDPNVLELPEWRARLRENKLGESAPDAPVLLFHARRDPIVRYHQSEELMERWLALGADVRLYTIKAGVEHISAAVAGVPVALSWLQRRLGNAGAAAAPAAPALDEAA